MAEVRLEPRFLRSLANHQLMDLSLASTGVRCLPHVIYHFTSNNGVSEVKKSIQEICPFVKPSN